MRVINQQLASQLLDPSGIRIGDWNELLCSLQLGGVLHRSYSPPAEALELYVAAHRLAQWVISGNWTLLQVDNSTSPTEDEIAVFEKLIFNGEQSWDVAEQRTFLLEGAERLSTLVLLIYFALLFTWHIHLASEASLEGRRLALQDGGAYFYGNDSTLQDADELIVSLTTAPLKL
ncbi:hypothetical protein [Nitrincola sp. MINF-07-Sa-05]|uniref:hypothetical protein n=1 Tax=Nitrincola salilacus TaxID=3400273 RepID=UPI003918500D